LHKNIPANALTMMIALLATDLYEKLPVQFSLAFSKFLNQTYLFKSLVMI